VIGSGYVGLVTGACLAEIGHDVICTDNDKSKIDTLEAGGVPIYEPGLDNVIAKARKEKRISFSANPADTIDKCEAIFICVGTPPLPRRRSERDRPRGARDRHRSEVSQARR